MRSPEQAARHLDFINRIAAHGQALQTAASDWQLDKEFQDPQQVAELANHLGKFSTALRPEPLSPQFDRSVFIQELSKVDVLRLGQVLAELLTAEIQPILQQQLYSGLCEIVCLYNNVRSREGALENVTRQEVTTWDEILAEKIETMSKLLYQDESFLDNTFVTLLSTPGTGIIMRELKKIFSDRLIRLDQPAKANWILFYLRKYDNHYLHNFELLPQVDALLQSSFGLNLKEIRILRAAWNEWGEPNEGATPTLEHFTICEMLELDAASPGIVAQLFRERRICFFTRYPQEVLLQQFDEDLSLESSVYITPYADHDGALRWVDACQDFTSDTGAIFRIYEFSNQLGLGLRIKQAAQTYGKIGRLVINSHGTASRISGRDKSFLTNKDVRSLCYEHWQECFIDMPEIYFFSCHAGKSDGLVETTNKLGVQAFGPRGLMYTAKYKSGETPAFSFIGRRSDLHKD